MFPRVGEVRPDATQLVVAHVRSGGTITAAGGTEFVGTLPGSATPPLQVVGDRVMIFADPGFYVSDGTAAGTCPLPLPTEIGTMLGFHGRDGFPVFQGQLWFSASGRSQLPGDMGLWRTDGTTALVHEAWLRLETAKSRARSSGKSSREREVIDGGNEASLRSSA